MGRCGDGIGVVAGRDLGQMYDPTESHFFNSADHPMQMLKPLDRIKECMGQLSLRSLYVLSSATQSMSAKTVVISTFTPAHSARRGWLHPGYTPLNCSVGICPELRFSIADTILCVTATFVRAKGGAWSVVGWSIGNGVITMITVRYFLSMIRPCFTYLF